MATFLHAALYALYLALFVWVIFRWHFFEVKDTPRKRFVFFFLLKVAAGVCLTLVYTYYYTDPQKADIYRYFNDSRVVSPLLFSDPIAWLKIMSGYRMEDPETFRYLLDTNYFSHGSDMITNNTFIIRVNVLLNYLSFTNIYINTLLMNFVAFVGLTAFYKVLRFYFQPFSHVLYLPLYLLPSFLFWSSGLLKEELLFTAICMFFYAILKPEGNAYARFGLFVTALAILLCVKIHVFAVVVFSMVFFFTGLSKQSYPIVPVIVLLGAATVQMLINGSRNAVDIIGKRNEFIELALKENAGSLLNTQIIEPTVSNLFSLFPSAFVNAILRPFVWDGGTAFQLAFAIENLAFLLLIVFLLFFFKKPTTGKLILSMCFFFFAMVNYLVIGLTVPIMGAIVHYRVICAPFLLMAVLLLVDLEKLKKTIGYSGYP